MEWSTQWMFSGLWGVDPMRLKILLAEVLLLGLGLTASMAAAQTFPVKPIRMLVGYSPGGTTDIIARTVSQKLSANLGQQVIVDNRAGGGGMIAVEMVAKSAPDGYTLLMGTISTLATNVSMYSKLPYDPVRDFSAVTLVAASPYLITLHPSVPANTLREFIALAKAQPGRLNFGSSGAGGGAHLSTEMFKSMAGINLVHVPYKGAAPAMTDLLSGQIQLVFNQPLIALPYMKAGRLKALAITSAQRLAAVPDVPTVAEAGVPGFEATAWQGVVAPKGTPAAIVGKLQAEIAKILRLPDVGDRLAAEGSQPGGNTPAEFGAFIKDEIAKWGKVAKQSGAKAD